MLRDKYAYCNGVYIPVTDKDIISLDERELKGSGYRYNRVLIENKYCDEKFKNAKVYIYESKINSVPQEETPLTQSYIDVVLAGCLDYNYEFAKEFCETTTYWNENWLNDRKKSLYHHPKDIENQYETIDKILQESSLLKLRKK